MKHIHIVMIGGLLVLLASLLVWLVYLLLVVQRLYEQNTKLRDRSRR